MEFAVNQVRTLFLSDVHLGSKYCQPDALHELLNRVEPERLVIVGDFCDGWLLRRSWHWPDCYQRIVQRVLAMHEQGTQVIYLLGNHDRCLHRFISEWADFWVGEQCILDTADGRRFLAIHGDQFDASQHRFKRAAGVSALIHERMLGGSRIANHMLHEMGWNSRRIASTLTGPVKQLMQAMNRYQKQLAEHALKHKCDGIISGHTHTPRLFETDALLFVNTGDWLEHCSVAVETHSGQLELWRGEARGWWRTCQRIAVSPAARSDITPDVPGALSCCSGRN